MLHHLARAATKSASMPRCKPSTSAACMRNSEQYGSRDLMVSTHVSEESVKSVKGARDRG